MTDCTRLHEENSGPATTDILSPDEDDAILEASARLVRPWKRSLNTMLIEGDADC